MLRISEDLEFQRKEWRAQRIGWACMALLIVAGGLGLAGDGPAAGRVARSSDGALTIHYDRFIRLEALTTLELRLEPGAEPAIWVSADYLDHVNVRSVIPAPRAERLGTDRHVFIFSSAAPAGGGTISLEVEPRSMGSLGGEVGVVGGEAIGFRQIVLP